MERTEKMQNYTYYPGKKWQMQIYLGLKKLHSKKNRLLDKNRNIL